MEVFISNLDSRTTRDQLKHSLTPILQKLHIQVFDLRKSNQKTFAQLTLADAQNAQKVLAYAAQNPTLLASPSGRYAQFSPSRHPPQPQLLRVLQKEEKDFDARQSRSKTASLRPEPVSRADDKAESIDLFSLECGRWETINDNIVFVPYYFNDASSSLTGTRKALVIKLNTSTNRRYDLVMDFYAIQSMSYSKVTGKSSLTITLTLAPKIFEDEQPTQAESMSQLLSQLGVGTNPRTATTRFREVSLPQSHSTVTGSCLTYRLTLLRESIDIMKFIQKTTFHRFSPLRDLDSPRRIGPYPLADYTAKLNADMSKRNASFGWRFQVQALWANGLLSPREVRLMFPAMDSLRARSGEPALIKVLSRLAVQLSFTDTNSSERDGGFKGAIAAMTQQEKYILEDEPSQRSTRDEVSVHRATVTPTGIYLYGPESVPANRVLRKYRTRQDCFLRVLFADEDEERVQFDRDASNERILHGRFLSILRKGIDVAGEHFNFLGFSHSSLRTHTCWFMRSFIHEGSLMFAQKMVSELGDFSLIHCPAKCAARIGQAFSETTRAIQIDPEIVMKKPDVKVGRYVFTDGCGTMSRAAWRLLRGETSSKTQPTSYQIRYRGKGYLHRRKQVANEIRC